MTGSLEACAGRGHVYIRLDPARDMRQLRTFSSSQAMHNLACRTTPAQPVSSSAHAISSIVGERRELL
jgi:hypothetical protein